MAVFPIASSLINRTTTVLPKRNVARQCCKMKPIQNVSSKIANSPKFQKLLDNFVGTIKMMYGIK